MERGKHMYEIKGNIAAIKWMDTKPVTVLTSAFDPAATENVSRRLKNGSETTISRPLAVKKYTEIMGGVDRFDQYRAKYMIGRKSKKWWHSIMYYYIDVAIINAFILMKCHKKDYGGDQLSFRLQLAKQLIGKYNGRKRYRRDTV